MKVPGLNVSFEKRRRGAYVGTGFVVHMPTAMPAARRAGRARRQPSAARWQRKPRGTITITQATTMITTTRATTTITTTRATTTITTRNPSLLLLPQSQTPRATAPASLRPRPSDPLHHHRDYAEIRRLLKRAALDPDVQGAGRGDLRPHRRGRIVAAWHSRRPHRVPRGGRLRLDCRHRRRCSGDRVAGAFRRHLQRAGGGHGPCAHGAWSGAGSGPRDRAVARRDPYLGRGQGRADHPHRRGDSGRRGRPVRRAAADASGRAGLWRGHARDGRSRERVARDGRRAAG